MATKLVSNKKKTCPYRSLSLNRCDLPELKKGKIELCKLLEYLPHEPGIVFEIPRRQPAWFLS